MEKHIWLVKSSGRLLGPFSVYEIIAHVHSQSLSLIDEMKRPDSGWNFVRDHSDVLAAVKNLSSQSVLVENTKDLSAKTFTHTQTETMGANSALESADEADMSPKIENETEVLGRVIKAYETTLDRTKSKNDGAPVYGFAEGPEFEKNLKNKKNSRKRFLILSGLILLLSISGFFVYQEMKQRKKAQKSVEQIFEARQYFEMGDFQKSFDRYISLYPASEKLLSTQDKLLLAHLELRNQGHSSPVAEAILAQISEPKVISEWRLWAFAKLKMAAYRKEWAEAQFILSRLESVLPSDFEVQLAAPYLLFLTGQIEQAQQKTLSLLQTVSHGERAYDQVFALYSYILLSIPHDKGQASDLKLVDPILEGEFKKNIESYHPYIFSKSIYSAYYDIFNGKPELAMEKVKQLMDYNFFDHPRYIRSITAFDGFLNFKTIVPICESVTNALIEYAEKNGEKADSVWIVQNYCVYHGRDANQALKSVAVLRKQDPQSPYLAAFEAILLLDQDKLADASSRIKFCGQLNMCLFAEANICYRQSDQKCLSFLREKAPNQTYWGPFYYWLNAYLEKQRQNEFSANNYIKEGLAQYPDYQPLLKLRSL